MENFFEKMFIGLSFNETRQIFFSAITLTLDKCLKEVLEKF